MSSPLGTSARLVLAPDVGFAEVATALAGWEGGPTDLTTALGGEPVSARWRRDGVEVSYSANPALGLRVLDGAGVRAVAALPPTMSVDQASRLARGADPAESLLGITALGLLGDPVALPVLNRIGSDRTADPALAGAAALAVRRIGLAGLVTGADRVAERRGRHADRDPVLGLLRPVSARRQVLRAFLADAPDDRARVLDVVRAGLADADWEVRWSAVLGAHDRRLREVLPEVRRCLLPADRDVCRVLDAVRDVVGHRLAVTPARISGASRIEAALDESVPAGDWDDAFLLIASLRHPVAEPADETVSGTWASLTRVPSVPHWVGTEATSIRLATPEAPYAVMTDPRADVAREQVATILADLGRECGRRLRLPTPDELEMATRGPDGRRFPWGNAREPGWRRARSPWGLAVPLLTAEWVDDEGALLALPPARLGCGLSPGPADMAAVRGVPSPG